MADRDKLRDVVVKILDVLEKVVQSKTVLFPKELREKIEKAWNELNAIKEGSNDDETTSTIDEIKGAVDKANINEQRKRGLTKDNLELKTFGFLEAYNDFDNKGGIKRLKRFFKYTRVILDSLGSIVPGVEIIKEFMDAVELGIEKAEE